MAHHIHDGTFKYQKHSRDTQDIRVILADYILNFEFPRDFYMILIAIFTFYIAIKLFRFSLRVMASLIRPIFFIMLILIVLPYLYEMKFGGLPSNRMVTSAQVFGQNIYRILHSVYIHTVEFYAKNF